MKKNLILLCFCIYIQNVFAEKINMEFAPLCLDNNDTIAFHLIFNIKYSLLSKKKNVLSRQFYQMQCSKKTKECETGITFNPDKKFNFMSIGTFSGAQIVSSTGHSYVIKWGLYRTFTYNSRLKTVTFVESSHNSEGRAVVKCGSSNLLRP